MDFLIDHKRFKRQFNQKDLIKYLPSKNKIVKFPQYKKDYYNFASNYLKNKNRLTKNICPCGEDNDVLISLTDRNCINFVTVICKSCGLMRVKDYIINKYVIDFYEHYYRNFFNVMTPNDKTTATRTSAIGGTSGQTKFQIHTKTNHPNHKKSKSLIFIL